MAELFDDYEIEDREEDDVEAVAPSQLVVFLVDARSAFQARSTFETVRDALVNKIVALGFESRSNKAAVVFFGTTQEKGWEDNSETSLPNTYVLFDIGAPDAAKMTDLAMLDFDDEKDNLIPNGPSPLADEFYTLKGAANAAAARLARVRGKARGTTVLVILTGSSAEGATTQEVAAIEAGISAVDRAVVFSTAPTQGALAAEDDEGAGSLWQRVQRVPGSAAAAARALATGSIATLRIDLDRRWPVTDAPRGTRHVTLRLSERLHLPLKMTNLASRTSALPAYKLFDATSGEELVRSSALVDADTGGVVESVEQQPRAFAMTSAGFTGLPETVVLSASEAEDVSAPEAFGTKHPSLTLIGVTRVVEVGLHHQVSKASFVYLDPPARDRGRGGSGGATPDVAARTSAERCVRKLFLTFWIALKSNPEAADGELAALCAFRRSAKDAPRLVALLAQDAQESEDGTQIQPPGLSMHVLPYTDEMRVVAPSHPMIPPACLPHGVPPHRASDGAVAAAGALVDALTDPSLTRHTFAGAEVEYARAYLSSQVLGSEPPERGSFGSTRAYLQARARARPVPRDVVGAFEQMVLGGSRLDPEAATSGSKRAAPTGNALPDADIATKVPWKELAAKGAVKGKTVDTLKAYLRFHKLKTAGKKADLVDRVTEHASQR